MSPDAFATAMEVPRRPARDRDTAVVESTFRPDIEGLRAIAIVLVVACHAGIPWLRGGFIGVDVFFVLSGYLITRLLLREIEASSSIDLSAFYARRVRRLVPALTVMVVFVIVTSAIVYAPFEHRVIDATAAASSLYGSNVYFVRTVSNYHAADAQLNPLLHTWSLSVEEQFYLVWPLLLLLSFRLRQRANRPSSGNSWIAVPFAFIALAAFAASMYLTRVRQPWAFFLAPPRAWQFAVGGLAVLWPAGGAAKYFLNRCVLARRSRATECPKTSTIAACAAIAVLFGSAVWIDERTAFPGTAALLPVVAAVVLLAVNEVDPANGVARALARRPMQIVGRLSYSWYLWHWPVLVLAEALCGPLPLVVRVSLMLGAFGIAALSYRLVENPFRHSGMLRAQPRLTLALGLGMAISGVAVSLAFRAASAVWASLPAQTRFSRESGTMPRIYDLGCDVGFYSTEAKTCSFGPAGATQVVVLIGDSHAGQWFPAMEAASASHGWRLVVVTKSACAMVEVPYVYQTLGRRYWECEEWRSKAVAEVAALRPTITVVTSSESYPFSDAEWRRGTAEVLRALSRVSQHVVLLRDTPQPGFDVPKCLARKQWRPAVLSIGTCNVKREAAIQPEVFALERDAASRFSNVGVVDMSDQVCPGKDCDLSDTELIRYRDSNHISVALSRCLADVLGERIAAVLRDSSGAGGQTVDAQSEATRAVSRRPCRGSGSGT